MRDPNSRAVTRNEKAESRSRSWWWLSSACVVALVTTVGCAPKPVGARVVTTDPQEIVHASIEDAERRHVPAGSMLTLRMASEIDMRTAKVGERFEATVVEPLRGPDGSVVVPAGAVVRGTVERIRKGRELALALDNVRVGSQEVALDAKVQAADLVPAIGAREGRGREPHYPSATATFPAGTGGTVEPRFLEPGALGGKGRASGDLALPMGASLYLVLTRPIVL